MYGEVSERGVKQQLVRGSLPAQGHLDSRQELNWHLSSNQSNLCTDWSEGILNQPPFNPQARSLQTELLSWDLITGLTSFWVHRINRKVCPCFCSATLLPSCRGACTMTSHCSAQTAPRWADRGVKPGLWLNSGSRPRRRAQPAFDHWSTS